LNPYPFAVRHFIIFRLCPTDLCSSCDYTAHGRYLMPAEDYLQMTLQEQVKQFQSMCSSCEEECDEDGGNCYGCGKLCYVYNNLEANGYVDAVDYLECQPLQEMNNDNNNHNNNNANADDAANEQSSLALYIGPRCSNNGGSIGIGLFYDQYCRKPYIDTTPEEMLGYNISYSVLSNTYTAGGNTCLGCKEDSTNDDTATDDVVSNDDDQQDVDDVNAMCEAAYLEAAKCESKYGIDGFIQMKRDDGNKYRSHVENEYTVCEYIESLMLDSYTESGEINLKGEQLIIYRGVTPLQWTSFWLVSFSIAALFIIAFFFQRKIENSYPMLDLSCQGDSHMT
jgi:hypothetical protein